jgi:hypothetical protein
VTFQTYINNIKKLTGKTPEDFKKLLSKKGFSMTPQQPTKL